MPTVSAICSRGKKQKFKKNNAMVGDLVIVKEDNLFLHVNGLYGEFVKFIQERMEK